MTTVPAATAASTVAVAPPSATPPPALSANQIVLSLDDLNTLTSEAKYRGGSDLADSKSPLPAGGQVDPPQCAPALRGLQNKSVAGGNATSFRALEAVTVGDPALPEEKRRKDDFVQVVAVYPSEASARAVFDALAKGVGACGNQRVANVEPGDTAKTEYTVKVEQAFREGADEPAKVRWSQHQAGWGQNQQCVLEARLVRSVVLQDIECGVGTDKAPIGQLLSQALDKSAGRVP
ncbi:sensor domain-containing protein [Segniliparus rugosus]|uniref:PknH-like extracellular domain-containing protein n=1 Tax=Segniliparus rugosus (strain ATCC BAA-974 / DSM 45345 / CCUG 50838 / CIP 108380 / JCM 13579 / CDC 945) TaxID=679197 RepID=E5XUR0_SEGRC|nr:sensor domain-containing protein [Segniliparus rugosus]EFV11898.2 hypothetical protein HMPREF9336_03232 [Segniliparus rugosus ATCC BAA-974]